MSFRRMDNPLNELLVELLAIESNATKKQRISVYNYNRQMRIINEIALRTGVNWTEENIIEMIDC